MLTQRYVDTSWGGWLTSPSTVDIDALGAGQTATVPATLHMPNCSPSVDDQITMQATAGDLPTGASCSTTATCVVLAVDDIRHELLFTVAGSNPFTGSTMLSYALPKRTPVRIEVFGLDGRRLRTLVDGEKEAGGHVVPFTLRDEGGPKLGPGVYFVSLTAGSDKRSVRLLAVA